MKFNLLNVIVLAVVFMGLVNPGNAQNICFSSLYDYNFDHAAGTARHLVEGDFDEDGDLDIVTSNYLSNNISILFNDGSGVFTMGSTYAAGNQTQGIVAADFNGDTHLDVAVANRLTNNFSVFIGIGNGTFMAAVNYTTGNGPQDLAVGDFNNDLIPDIASACQIAGLNAVSIHLGTGTGTFAAGVAQATGGGGPRWIVVDDFNGDGNDDVTIAKQLSAQVGVLFGTGTGSLGAAVNYAVGTNPYNVFVSDIDNDTHPDLIAACNGSTNIYGLLNNSATPGTFLPAVSYATGTGPHAVLAADFDNDGTKEVAAINNTESNVSVFENDGTGALTFRDRFAVLGSSHNFLSADFDGDSDADLLMASTS
jgi:hypothetical protein